MALNKKSQLIFLKMMLGITIFIIAMVLIPPMKEGVTGARNETGLNCSSAEISAVDQATCTVVDIGFLFYFISVCIAVGIAQITGRKNITGVLTAITVFVVVVVLITPLKSLIIIARDATHLNCASTAISVGARMTCIFVDLWLFYFVIVCIATAITYVTVKKFVPERI